MWIEKIEKRIGIHSKTGKARFSALLTFALVFLFIWGGMSLFTQIPTNTILMGSVIAALFGGVLAFVKKLAEEEK